MAAIVKAPAPNPALSQATELSVLVDLEARWENLRIYQPATPGMPYTLKELQEKQKAYETFRAKLAAFNKKYAPAHIPELLLNNPLRLGLWCKKMRDLYAQVEHDPSVPFPAHLLSKAYRYADGMAGKSGRDQFVRSQPAESTQAAIRELDALAQWCDAVMRKAG